MSVIKVDSDGASCQDMVCHVRFLLLLLPPWPGRPARASPAALGTARGLVQRPAHQDAAVQEHLLHGDTAAGSVHSSGDHWHCCHSHSIPVAHVVCVQHRHPQPKQRLRALPCVPSPESPAKIPETRVGRQGIGWCEMILQMKGGKWQESAWKSSHKCQE